MILDPVKLARVCIEQDVTTSLWSVRPLAEGEKLPSPATAVFVLRPIDLDTFLRAPIGQRTEGEGADKWRRFVADVISRHVVGWENVVDSSGKPVEFKAEYLTDGTVDPVVANNIYHYLLERVGERRAAAGLGAASGNGRRPKPTSGPGGPALPTAASVTRNAKKRASARRGNAIA